MEWHITVDCDCCYEGTVTPFNPDEHSRPCMECEGQGYHIFVETLYETKADVREDYPNAIRIDKGVPYGS